MFSSPFGGGSSNAPITSAPNRGANPFAATAAPKNAHANAPGNQLRTTMANSTSATTASAAASAAAAAKPLSPTSNSSSSNAFAINVQSSAPSPFGASSFINSQRQQSSSAASGQPTSVFGAALSVSNSISAVSSPFTANSTPAPFAAATSSSLAPSPQDASKVAGSSGNSTNAFGTSAFGQQSSFGASVAINPLAAPKPLLGSSGASAFGGSQNAFAAMKKPTADIDAGRSVFTEAFSALDKKVHFVTGDEPTSLKKSMPMSSTAKAKPEGGRAARLGDTAATLDDGEASWGDDQYEDDQNGYDEEGEEFVEEGILSDLDEANDDGQQEGGGADAGGKVAGEMFANGEDQEGGDDDGEAYYDEEDEGGDGEGSYDNTTGLEDGNNSGEEQEQNDGDVGRYTMPAINSVFPVADTPSTKSAFGGASASGAPQPTSSVFGGGSGGRPSGSGNAFASTANAFSQVASIPTNSISTTKTAFTAMGSSANATSNPFLTVGNGLGNKTPSTVPTIAQATPIGSNPFVSKVYAPQTATRPHSPASISRGDLLDMPLGQLIGNHQQHTIPQRPFEPPAAVRAAHGLFTRSSAQPLSQNNTNNNAFQQPSTPKISAMNQAPKRPRSSAPLSEFGLSFEAFLYAVADRDPFAAAEALEDVCFAPTCAIASAEQLGAEVDAISDLYDQIAREKGPVNLPPDTKNWVSIFALCGDCNRLEGQLLATPAGHSGWHAHLVAACERMNAVGQQFEEYAFKAFPKGEQRVGFVDGIPLSTVPVLFKRNRVIFDRAAVIGDSSVANSFVSVCTKLSSEKTQLGALCVQNRPTPIESAAFCKYEAFAHMLCEQLHLDKFNPQPGGFVETFLATFDKTHRQAVHLRIMLHFRLGQFQMQRTKYLEAQDSLLRALVLCPTSSKATSCGSDGQAVHNSRRVIALSLIACMMATGKVPDLSLREEFPFPPYDGLYAALESGSEELFAATLYKYLPVYIDYQVAVAIYSIRPMVRACKLAKSVWLMTADGSKSISSEVAVTALMFPEVVQLATECGESESLTEEERSQVAAREELRASRGTWDLTATEVLPLVMTQRFNVRTDGKAFALAPTSFPQFA